MLIHRFIIATTLLFGAGACTQHVRLEFPGSSKGAEYICTPTKGQEIKCVPATTIDPSQQNQADTVFFTLPTECKGSFSQITIHDSGSSHPTLDVLCSPLENRVE